MNKKFLIVSVIILTVVLVGGFFALEYVSAPENETGDDTKTDDVNVNNNVQPEVDIGKVQINGNDNSPGLTICSDKCGDGVCQTADLDCTDKSNMNCICPETKQDCPKDCK